MTEPRGGRAPDMADDAPPQPSQEDVERALAMAEQMRGQLAMLDEQRAILTNSLEDLRRATRTLEAMKTSKAGDVLLMPLGAGAYTQATLVAPDRILASVGSGVHIEGGADAALARTTERTEATETALKRVSAEAARIEQELNALARALQGLG